MWCLVGVLIVGVGCFYWGYYTNQKEYDRVRNNWIDAKKEVERLTMANKILGRGRNDE